MIWYSRLGTKGWASFTNWIKGRSSDAQDGQQLLAVFLYQMDHWQKSIPNEFQFKSSDCDSCDQIRWARAYLYLLGNQLRILMLRPFLYAHTGMAGNAENFITLAVSVACDNIRVLVDLEATSRLFHCQMALCTHFLITAISALFLVIIHRNPLLTNNLASLSRNEPDAKDLTDNLLLALNLFRSIGACSNTARKLSTMLSMIEGLVNRLPLCQPGRNQTPKQLPLSGSTSSQPVCPFPVSLTNEIGPENSPYQNASAIETGPVPLTTTAQLPSITADELRMFNLITTDLTERDYSTTPATGFEPISQKSNDAFQNNASNPLGESWDLDALSLEPLVLAELNRILFAGNLTVMGSSRST
jgi:hypothetical protein